MSKIIYSSKTKQAKQIINLLLFNHFYSIISYRRVSKESDELLYTVWPFVGLQSVASNSARRSFLNFSPLRRHRYRRFEPIPKRRLYFLCLSFFLSHSRISQSTAGLLTVGNFIVTVSSMLSFSHGVKCRYKTDSVFVRCACSDALSCYNKIIAGKKDK